MKRKPDDSPFKGGEWDLSDLDGYRKCKTVPLLWGLAFAIGMGILAFVIVWWAGWMGRR